MAKYWFRQKSFGYGATPNTWQAWLLTLVASCLVFAVVFEAMQMADQETAKLVALSGAAIVVIAFSMIAYFKTEGGWRWRSGKDD
jgi:membrane protein YdbS with pleckstrin-like domain